MKALDAVSKLDQEIMGKIENIVRNKPKDEIDWREN